MTPFKERMNLYRAYRELNPDKNYWDWKASLEVPAMSTGGNNEEYIAQNDAIPSQDKYRHDVQRELDLEEAVWLANHTDNNTGVVSPYYNAVDDTYFGGEGYEEGVPLDKLVGELVIRPEYKSAAEYERTMNRLGGAKGREYWHKGAQDATKFVGATVMAPLAVSMMSVPGIPMGMDLAGIFSGDASGLLSYLPLGKVSRLARALNKYDTPNLQMRLPIQTELIHTPSTSYPTGRTNLQLLERQSRLTSDELLGMPRHSRTYSITNQNYGRNFGEFDLRTNQHNTKILDDFIGEGSEHTVFQSRDPNFVYKVYTGASPKKEELRQFVERYSLRNNIDFAEPSIFKGYVTSKYGVHPVFKQKKLTPIAENAENRFELQNKIREMYKSAGWNDRMVKDGIQLNDMSVLNFAFDEFGNLRAIDVDVYPINGFKNGGVIPAMTDGGENKLLPDPAESYVDEYGIIHRNRYANGTPYEQGLELDPVADAFNPMNDAYDLVQIGKDATEGNWAGVGTGLVIAAMPKWMEKVGGAVKSGVKKLINKARNRDNVDWDEVVSGLAVPVKKDPTGIDAKPISDEIKVDDTHVAGLSGETAPRYIDYGNLEYRDHIGYTRPQWLKDVLEFYNTDVAAREKNITTKLGRFYNKPYDRSSMTLYSAHPTNVRLYLDDVNFAGYVHNDGIVIAKDSKLSPFLVMVHESGHIDQIDAYNRGVNYLGVWHDNEIDPIIPLTRSQFVVDNGSPILTTEYIPEVKNVLDDAYQFTEEYLEKHPDIARSLEAGSTNRENRADLWLAASKPSPAELDNIIDNMTDDDVLYLLSQGNGYSRDFYRSIKLRVENGANLHELVEKVKYAMKYIPAFAAPMALAVPQMTNETKDKSN